MIGCTAVGYDSCVGLLGATLGGGVGPYGGLHGLQLDSLLSVRMVTGTGSLINVSATSHPDLWWGMRGAGFNFGIVTSATYQIYDFTNHGQAMNADFRFHASQNASLYEFVRSYTGTLPDGFSIDVAIGYNALFGGVSHLTTISCRKTPVDFISRHISSPTSSMLARWKRVLPLSSH